MTKLSLFGLLSGRRSGADPVALARHGTVTTRDWGCRVAAVVDLVRESGGERWMLAFEDSSSFSAGLFGLLAAGKTVCLPSGLSAPALRGLAPNVERTLSDLPAPPDTAPWHALPPPAAEPLLVPRLPDGIVEFWTSGSTGLPKRVEKRLSQLDAEVIAQEKTFGRRFGNGPVVGTVPHFHIYGCLFRVLWPLHAGRVFRSASCGEPAELRRALAGPDPVALVSCPAHLSRLPKIVDLSRLDPPPAVVFSSGGPLDPADGAVWAAVAPGGVVEVYGSTESGGIAWRSPGARPAPAGRPLAWKPLPAVSLSLEPDGALRVRSPYAGAEPLRMEDAAELLPNGRLHLKGRLDRIVKLDERRVSLPEVEAALRKHPWVRGAAVVRLDGAHPTLGAVVVLSPREQRLLPAGRGELVHALREHVLGLVDGSAVPRRWRFVPSLPFDDGGKLTTEAVTALFERTSG